MSAEEIAAPSLVEAESRLELAITKGKELGRQSLYFGCWNRPGHYLHTPAGMTVRHSEYPDLSWSDALMDTGLLKNGKRPDIPDGKVFWTCGGLAFWYAFFWWDRSGDSRSNSNSGFYVRGFGWPEVQEAFDFACQAFPHIVARQKHELVVQGVPHPLIEGTTHD